MNIEYTSPSKIKIPEYLGGKWNKIEGKTHLSNYKIALLGVEDYRGNEANKGCEQGPDEIRKQLFKLKNFPSIGVLDIGNIKMGASFRDTRYALKQTLHELLKHDLIPIILGGDQTLLNVQQLAYQDCGVDFTNILHIDERFTIGEEIEEDYVVATHNYLERLFKQEPNLVFNYTQLGYQSYFVDQLSLDIIQKMGFETYRLGAVREDLTEVEPIVRDSDLIAFNVSAIGQVDAPGYYDSTPNGFTAEEACAIVRYAGLSDRLTSFGLYGYNPSFDQQELTAKVIAQMIWYFLQGVDQRKKDYPVVNENDFNKYIVSSKETGYDITFLKSKKSDRWWIQIPDNHVKFKSQQLVPCSYRDYETALNDEIPERWWKAYNKLV